ncbi:MAG: hypothetical protein COB24_00810 [Hyphomicrobiales bacterium]|nr:MAG: hypothetical protein COB24_00810 [Hyphomicrobiales bacterium]
MLSLLYSTEMQSFAKLELTKLNEIRLGGELTSDQRLSGLARERSERTQCQAKNSFQSINNQPTVFQQHLLHLPH